MADFEVVTVAVGGGLIATNKLGTGTPDNTTFLRGDQTYAVPAGGGGGATTATHGRMLALFQGYALP